MAIGGAYLWHEYQNPLFPYFNNIFQSPVTLPTTARDTNFVPASNWLRLIFPFAWTLDPKLVGEVPFRDLKLPLLYSLLPIAAVLTSRVRHRLGRMTVAQATYPLFVVGIAYAAWLFMFAIYRYAVPLEMLAAPCVLVSLDRIFTGLRTKQIAMALALVACLACTQVANWSRTSFGPNMVTVEWPPLLNENDPAKTMIIMAGFQPYSHVVPSLPAAMPVIRIQSNFASPGEAKGINDQLAVRVRDWLEAPDHKILFLIPVYDAPWIGEERAAAIQPETKCKPMPTCSPQFRRGSQPVSADPVIKEALKPTPARTITVAPGFYRHYKGTVYRVLGTGWHSETEAELVFYHQADDINRMFARARNSIHGCGRCCR